MALGAEIGVRCGRCDAGQLGDRPHGEAVETIGAQHDDGRVGQLLATVSACCAVRAPSRRFPRNRSTCRGGHVGHATLCLNARSDTCPDGRPDSISTAPTGEPLMALRPEHSSDLLIDGKLVPGSGGTFDVVNPATEEGNPGRADATRPTSTCRHRRARRAFDTTDWARDHAFRASACASCATRCWPMPTSSKNSPPPRSALPHSHRRPALRRPRRRPGLVRRPSPRVSRTRLGKANRWASPTSANCATRPSASSGQSRRGTSPPDQLR